MRVMSRDSSETHPSGTGPRYGSPLQITGGTDYMAVATVYRCVSVLSDSVAGLPLHYMLHKGGRYAIADNSPMEYMLSVEPTPMMSSYTMWSMAVKDMLLWGNAYIYPRKVDGEVTDLVLCRPWLVSYDDLNDLYTIHDAYNGVDGTFYENEIIHLFLHSHNGKRGISVLEHARRTIEIATAGDGETASRFSNGGNVKAFVTNDKNGVTGYGEYQDDQLSTLADDLDQRIKGRNFVSLPGQVDVKTVSMSAADMQFLESRKFTVIEICRFFGVEPSFVFADTSTNYKSAENANRNYLVNTQDPILKRIEAELNRKLIGRKGIGKAKIMYDRSGVYSLDLQSKANYYKTMEEIGAMSANDIRMMENMPSTDGGDTALVSANLVPLKSGKLWCTDPNQKSEKGR